MKKDYKSSPLSYFRVFLSETARVHREKNYFSALVEFDITDTRKNIKEARNRNDKRVSLLAYLACCISRCMKEFPELNSLIKGKRLITFSDTDISIMIEADYENEKIPAMFVLRKANEKNVFEVEAEIVKEKERVLTSENGELWDRSTANKVKLVMALPKPLRMILWKYLLHNPFFIKRTMGTTVISSVGMFAKLPGGMVLNPTGGHASVFAVGAVDKKPVVCDNEIQIREMINMTLIFDHDVIDGARAARFINTFRRCVESESAEILQLAE